MFLVTCQNRLYVKPASLRCGGKLFHSPGPARGRRFDRNGSASDNRTTSLNINVLLCRIIVAGICVAILVELLTSHADLNRHLKIMVLRNEAVCPLCQLDEEETSIIHFTAQCNATMLLRRSILGDYTLSLDTLKRYPLDSSPEVCKSL